MSLSTDGGPKLKHAAITPSDTTILTKDGTAGTGLLYHALYITGAGNIAIEDKYGTVITYAVPANFIMPFRPYRVRSTNTTATGIVGWGE
jgi:hypothetical protein